jgi:hypothetical protein
MPDDEVLALASFLGRRHNDLAFKPAFVLRDRLLHLVQPHGENDRVGSSDRAFDRVGAGAWSQLLCERFGLRLVQRG